MRTYAYPTAADFHAGAFDVTHFQVIDAGSQVVLRTTFADLTPTFGSDFGAQLLDIYIHDPAATATSTAAADPGRNYSIAAGSAWSSRLEVQGFAPPVFVDPAGASLGQVEARTSTAARTETIAVPKSALGTPKSGWSFTVVLTGQDGSAPGQARQFTPTAGEYTFDVCTAAAIAAGTRSARWIRGRCPRRWTS